MGYVDLATTEAGVCHRKRWIMVAAGTLSRGLAVLSCLVGEVEGVPLARISDQLGLPRSATHRILATLTDEGFVFQLKPSGNYALTLRVVGLGLRHLATSTITGLAKPVLVRLARTSGQLVRLSLVDREQLIWVAKEQGAKSGLRYDADVDHGHVIPLDSTATGIAWLSALPEDRALRLVARQEPPRRHPVGPGMPRSLTDVTARIREAREQGWARVHESNERGISAMAMPLVDAHSGEALGAVSIAGPSILLTEDRVREIVPALQQTVDELGGIAAALAGEAHRNES